MHSSRRPYITFRAPEEKIEDSRSSMHAIPSNPPECVFNTMNRNATPKTRANMPPQTSSSPAETLLQYRRLPRARVCRSRQTVYGVTLPMHAPRTKYTPSEQQNKKWHVIGLKQAPPPPLSVFRLQTDLTAVKRSPKSTARNATGLGTTRYEPRHERSESNRKRFAPPSRATAAGQQAAVLLNHATFTAAPISSLVLSLSPLG